MTPSPQPKYIRVDHGEFTLEFEGHSSVEDYDSEAGSPGSALETADRWHIHRETIDRFGEIVMPVLESMTSVPRKIDDKATAKRRSYSTNPDRITPIYESLSKYTSRLYAIYINDKAKRNEIQSVLTRYARLVKVSAAPAIRTAPVEPMYYKRADSLLEANSDMREQKISRYLTQVPNYELARDQKNEPVRDSLARLLQKADAAAFANED